MIVDSLLNKTTFDEVESEFERSEDCTFLSVISNQQPARPCLAGRQAAGGSAISRRGFTLIEMLVAIALFAVVGTIGTDIFLSVIRSSNKATIIAELERNGNVALTMMAAEIRNARVLGTCSVSSCTITNQEGVGVTFAYTVCSGGNGCITRNNNPVTDTAPSSGVNVTSLSFDPTRPTGAPPVVTITLGLSQPVGAPGRIDYQASTTLTTTVSLRTY